MISNYSGDRVKEFAKRFADLISPGDTVFDGGASFGYYSILASLKTNEAGQVVAFEPYDKVRSVLETNVMANELSAKVVVKGVGLAVADGAGKMVVSGRNPQVDANQKAGETALTTLDAYPIEPDVVKIDVEGMETAVLEGGVRTLSRRSPAFLVEVHRTQKLAEMGGTVAGFITYCRIPKQHYCEVVSDREGRHHLLASNRMWDN